MKQGPLRAFIRRQNIVYRVAGTAWDEALPLGDGCFGGMAWQEADEFLWTINHLDVYMAFNPNQVPIPVEFEGRYREIVDLARAAHRHPDSPEARSYARILYPSYYTGYGWLREGAWMNLAGLLRIKVAHPPAEALRFEHVLDLYDAAVEATCRWEQGELRLRSYAARNHRTLVVEIDASAPGLIESLAIQRTLTTASTAPASGVNGGDVYLADTLRPTHPAARESASLGYALYARLLDEHGQPIEVRPAQRTESRAHLPWPRGVRRGTLLLTVALDGPSRGAVEAARGTIAAAQGRGVAGLRRDHRRHWHGFWRRSHIELSDRFLETLWHVNLYALACCDGEGMRFASQATGLNGLWDVKNSCAWGSCWYWDVNIQQAYWGCYTANHLEMTQPFYDGLRQYLPAARQWAREFYHARGLAGDYPYTFYHTIWPWCCQFLWWGYRYSMDETFLRDVAYPIMREVLHFFEDFLQRDGQGHYSAFPTVSPEQGPLGPNATILLACLQYLLTAAIDANRRLKADPGERRTWQRLLRDLSPLPIGESPEFGETIKDSDWAPPTLYLGHPSLLMPIYPAGLIGPESPARLRRIAANTLRYVERREAISTHNYGWLAAAAARLGLGDEAVRILYQQGLAHALRPNGLLAEETDRWIDNCAVLSGPVSLPAMPEASGALLGAINEMLLQSRDGKVRVFPAVPSTWPTARFERLLAEGAWEVSAEYRDGKTRWVEVSGRAGGTCRLVVNGKTTALTLKPGETRRLAFGSRLPRPARRHAAGPPSYAAPSRRRVFLGRTADTEYLRRLDDFLYDYQLGDRAIPRATKYKFDFGPAEGPKKDYAAVIPQQEFVVAEAGYGKLGADFYRLGPASHYTELRRFGWQETAPLQAVDRGRPDAQRRDFVGGTAPPGFWLELPRGQYQLLFVVGDAGGETDMSISVTDQFRWQTVPRLRAGEFSVQVLPVRQVRDGLLEIEFSGSWKLNLLMVNRVP
jgi:hypothetical protein